MRRNLGGIGDDAIDRPAQLGEQRSVEHVRHDQIAEVTILFDFTVAQHWSSRRRGASRVFHQHMGFFLRLQFAGGCSPGAREAAVVPSALWLKSGPANKWRRLTVLPTGPSGDRPRAP